MIFTDHIREPRKNSRRHDKPNQWEKQVDGKFGPEQWLDFRPTTPITEAGLRNNINVGIYYLGSWLAGNGCVLIHNLMEDAATAEISRSQVWQWVVSPKGDPSEGDQRNPLPTDWMAQFNSGHHDLPCILERQQ